MLPTTTATLPDGTTGECVLIDNTDDSFTIDIPLDDSVIVNKIYTFSMYANPTAEASIKMSSGGTSADYIDYTIPKGWSRIRIPFTLTAKTISFTLSASKIYLYKAQVEEGSVLSDWKPTTDDAENDVDTKLANYSTKSETKAAIELASDSITMTVNKQITETNNTVSGIEERVTKAESSIKQNADTIELKVSKNGVISAINQTEEEVTIDASKINLNGAVTANEKFKINTDGSAEAVEFTAQNSINLYMEYMDEKLEKFEVLSTGYNSETFKTGYYHGNNDWVVAETGIIGSGTGKFLNIGKEALQLKIIHPLILTNSLSGADGYFSDDLYTDGALGCTSDFSSGGNAYISETCNAKSFNTTSSKLTKTNITDLTEEEAQKLLDVNIVSFDYKDGFGDKNQRGVIAEDVVGIIPSAVFTPPNYNADDFDESKGRKQPLMSVDYSKFVPYLIKMVQIQQREIQELKEMISKEVE